MCHVPTRLSELDDVDKTLRNIKEVENLANAEWKKFKSRIDPSDDQDKTLLYYNDLRFQIISKREDLIQRRELLLRVSELDHDLGICRQHLAKLVDAACGPSGIDVSGDYLGKLENINSEVMNLRKTVPVSLIRNSYIEKPNRLRLDIIIITPLDFYNRRNGQ